MQAAAQAAGGDVPHMMMTMDAAGGDPWLQQQVLQQQLAAEALTPGGDAGGYKRYTSLGSNQAQKSKNAFVSGRPAVLNGGCVDDQWMV